MKFELIRIFNNNRVDQSSRSFDVGVKSIIKSTMTMNRPTVVNFCRHIDVIYHR